MPTLCRPAVFVPPNVIGLDETLALASKIHAHHEQLPLVLRLIRNTKINKRHIVQPIEETLRHPGFEARNLVYVREAKACIPKVVHDALSHARLAASQVDAIVFVSCTGFTMPSLIAWMINELDFRNDTRQLPIAQMGCAAGGAAINRAHDFCLAYPGSNVLIVACEFCSLCYQPTDLSVGNLLSNGLFGDAVGAAVVRGRGGDGILLTSNGSRLVLGTEDWISYSIKATGFHFCLDKRVPGTMEQLAPELRSVAGEYGWDASDLDFYIIHAGGPRILDDLSHFLGVAPSRFDDSRATLMNYGNVASVVVLDAARRMFEAGAVRDGARGMVAGFGPGITAEITLGQWIGPALSAATTTKAHIEEVT
ncbi:type III polyketide synthase [Dyella caseinilytica]|uniref:Type III polyketide synthase n=1 Tax=Dyella caseinilytica TaxID=1849581 RepID=A0ABX7GYD4_9GAMM|nr:type III polyketide synthase [Dyella caseinilytica]QRN54200.1 type III polyketide synthase [Dyella caseinilytica]GFZ92291.1 1,3,6,8-tetrahydroxynaphthalene synthase [Dyella caseinilytica]